MNKSKIYSKLMLFAFVLFFGYACQNDYFIAETPSTDEVATTDLQELDYTALKQIESHLESQGYDISEIQIDTSDPNLKAGVMELFVKVVKVSCKTDHPNGSGQKIDLSGVMIVPKMGLLTKLTNHRLVVVPPPTYTANSQAPSVALTNSLSLLDPANNPLSYLSLLALKGFIVIIPDYPGYGDSFNQCFHPYLKASSLVNSTIDFIGASQKALKKLGYKYKSKISVGGYSQGGFVASSLVRELETNTSHNIKVNALIAGGTPCNLKQIADIVRRSETTRHTYYLPYAFIGYKLNGYPQIDESIVFKEPYLSKIPSVFDGYNTNPNDEFPTKVSDLYTEAFLKNFDTDPRFTLVNNLLDQNSLKPWLNSCKFVLIHSTQDDSVYYMNAKDYAKVHKAAGGKVDFYNILGTHTIAAVGYFPLAATLLKKYDILN